MPCWMIALRSSGLRRHVLEMRNKIGAREIAAKQDLVADHDAHDVAVFLRNRIACSISRSLRARSVSSHAPSVTRMPWRFASAGTSPMVPSVL